jgi:hypothetical protein
VSDSAAKHRLKSAGFALVAGSWLPYVLRLPRLGDFAQSSQG